MKWRRKRSHMEPQPPMPSNVRLVAPDGTVVPVELVYVGRMDGTHQWKAVSPVQAGPGWQLRADSIPGHTSIEVYGAFE